MFQAFVEGVGGIVAPGPLPGTHSGGSTKGLRASRMVRVFIQRLKQLELHLPDVSPFSQVPFLKTELTDWLQFFGSKGQGRSPGRVRKGGWGGTPGVELA